MMDSRVPQARSCSRFFLLGLHGYGEKERSMPGTSRCAGTPEWLEISRIFCLPYKLRMAFQMPDDTEGDLSF